MHKWHVARDCLREGDIAHFAHIQSIFIPGETTWMHPLCTVFRVHTLDPLILKKAINDIIFACTQANSTLIWGNLCCLQSTIISTILLLAMSSMYLCHWLLSKFCFFFFFLSASLSSAFRFFSSSLSSAFFFLSISLFNFSSAFLSFSCSLRYRSVSRSCLRNSFASCSAFFCLSFASNGAIASIFVSTRGPLEFLALDDFGVEATCG